MNEWNQSNQREQSGAIEGWDWITEIHSDKLHLADEFNEHVVILKLLDDVRVGIFLDQEPIEDALLVLQVAGVDDGLQLAVAEEDDGRKRKDAHLAGKFLIVDLDEIHATALGLVVDVLQLGQHRVALLAVHIAV